MPTLGESTVELALQALLVLELQAVLILMNARATMALVILGPRALTLLDPDSALPVLLASLEMVLLAASTSMSASI